MSEVAADTTGLTRIGRHYNRLAAEHPDKLVAEITVMREQRAGRRLEIAEQVARKYRLVIPGDPPLSAEPEENPSETTGR